MVRCQPVGLGVSLALASPAALAGSITTPNIIAQTIAALADCLQWTLIGICFWLSCSPAGCVVKTSVLYGHYNPDLVNSGYHRVGETPWLESRQLYGALQKTAGQAFVNRLLPGVAIGEGNRPNDRFDQSHKDLRFKEADAIGHPLSAAALLRAALGLGLVPRGTIQALDPPTRASLDTAPLMCPSETAALTPYLLSTLDFVAWRLSLPEMLFPEALVPGLREIGAWPINTWQAVYPRSGWVLHTEDPRAGAVVVQRAGDIVTREGQPHVYVPTSSTRSTSTRVKVWYPGPLRERDRKTGQFQMLVPLAIPACEVFGEPDLVYSWGNHKTDTEADYAWNLWRPYECCTIKGVYIGQIRWTDFP